MKPCLAYFALAAACFFFGTSVWDATHSKHDYLVTYQAYYTNGNFVDGNFVSRGTKFTTTDLAWAKTHVITNFPGIKTVIVNGVFKLDN